MNNPAIIEESEIELIKNFLRKYSKIHVKKIDFTCETDSCDLETSQKENEGKLIDINNNKIKTILPTLGYMMLGELEKSFTPITSPNILVDLRLKFKYRIAR